MKIRLKLFASFRQIFNASEIEFELPEGATAQDLLDDLFLKYPDLRRFKGHVVVTINRQASPLTAGISDGDEVAILPPVSGG
ncbi:MAG: MoaD/ThiS family protein [Thermoplasmata archaeon]